MHPRHDDIGEHHVEAIRVYLQLCQGLFFIDRQ
jgi:hypothetical protein